MIFLTIFLGISIIQGLLQGILLIVVDLKIRKEAFLTGIIIIIVSFIGSHYLLTYTSLIYILPHLSGIVFPLLFLLGPLLRQLTVIQNNTKWYKGLLVHIIPFIISNIIFIPFYLKPVESKILYMRNYQSGQNSIIGKTLFWIALLHLLIYLYLSIKNKIKSKKNSTSIRIYMIFLIIILLEISMNIISYKFNITSGFLDNFDIIIVSLLLYTLGFRSFFNLKIEKAESYKGKKISNYEIKLFYNKFEKLLDEYFFLNPDMTLDYFSDLSGFHKNQISQYVNQELGINFKEWINNSRLEFFRIKLINNDYDSILQLAYDSGFNSKTTFNTLFRKKYNFSPSEYKKKFQYVK